MNSKYISEDKYYEINKKAMKKVLIFLSIGIFVSLTLLITGFIRKQVINKQNAKAYQIAYDESENKAKEAKKRIEDIKIEKDNLAKQIETKNNECSIISAELSDICNSELKTLRKNLSDLEKEKLSLERENYTVYYKIVSPSKYKVFFFLSGGFLVGIIIFSILIYDVIKDYEVNKFQDDEYVLPVQEKIEKIVPAINTFATEIIQDIKEEQEKDSDKEET